MFVCVPRPPSTPEGQVECGGGTEVTVGQQDLKKQNTGLFAPHSSSPGLGHSAALWCMRVNN